MKIVNKLSLNIITGQDNLCGLIMWNQPCGLCVMIGCCGLASLHNFGLCDDNDAATVGASPEHFNQPLISSCIILNLEIWPMATAQLEKSINSMHYIEITEVLSWKNVFLLEAFNCSHGNIVLKQKPRKCNLHRLVSLDSFLPVPAVTTLPWQFWPRVLLITRSN